MSSDLDLDDERKKIQDALQRQATAEGRCRAEQDRRRKVDQSARITQGRQSKCEEVDAKLRAAQQAQEAKARKAAEEADDRRDKQLRHEFRERLKKDWGRRLGHYKGARPPYTGKSEWGDLDPETLLSAAKASRPQSPGTWVTNFSGWIFGLEHPQRDPAWLSVGKTVEKHLIRMTPAESAQAWVRSVPMKSNGWRVLFEDDQTSASQSFTISALKVGSQSLLAKPDLVVEELHTGAIYIVERKASNREIPTRCWNNVRAQLWAYSQIDDWADNPNVTLCAEIWRHTPMGQPTGSQVLSWKRGDAQLEAAMPQLFEIYCQAGGA